MIFATIILMTAALPLMVKIKHITWISTGIVLIITGVFISLNSVKKFDSVDSYMKVLGSDSEVRYADVEALSKEFGVEGWLPYFKVWEEKCLAGSYDYCRIASYVPRVKREARAEELLRIGCTNQDFLSCYNYFFYDEFGEEDRRAAKSIILGQCSGNVTQEFQEICERVKGL